MLLENKNAVVYGAAGAVGGAIARAFAHEGATVFLAGRTQGPLDDVAREIRQAGGRAHPAVVDALNEPAVDNHLASLIGQAGHLDISVNAIGVDHVQGVPLVELAVEDYALPIQTYPITQFLTARAAARHMVDQGSGVILTMSTTAARVSLPSDGFGIACAGVEALSRQLAGELGPHGIRVVCLRPDAIPESARRGSHTRSVWGRAAERAGMTLDELLDGSPGMSGALLQRSPTLREVADVATVMASDRVTAMTGTVANVTCGAILD
ncbi:SDR family NAD(P)-dependent oxidoreductase [Phytoactinopolyspora limicola]|uniref:SDR family NAD(P)-dependent oxidoreductase n=1 Tax=Phytoactinopolyspora limicola TaxID=2715536 RepID=UPI00140A7E8B|nr:SDR family oxidoreductase [Phytoactinopolyspora limicola]